MSNHRFILRREWNPHRMGVVNFIMLNPSTADDKFDDPTIWRCVGFAKRWGFSGLIVTNLWAYRATDPKELAGVAVKDYVLAMGQGNDDHIDVQAGAASAVICAWGNGVELFGRDLQVASRLLDRVDLLCIRKSVTGNPVHRVREGYTDAPVPFMWKRIIVPERDSGSHV